MSVVSVFAPAKLNLFLHVVGRRDNGYHELQSLMLPIQWGDQIQIAPRLDTQLNRLTDLDFSAEKDLMIRAARLLQAYTSVQVGCDLTIDKQLPMGAGLGGGSSDAAKVLLALNALWQLDLSDEVLNELAIQLGSDVPFFLQDQAAILEGVGERITPIAMPTYYYVVLCPDVHVPTVQIFQDPHLNRKTPIYSHVEIEAFWKNFDPRYGRATLFGHNDLEEVACRLFPALAELRSFLKHLGLVGRMSGSGASFFVMTQDLCSAMEIQELIEQAAVSKLRLSCLRQVVVAKGGMDVAISSQIDKNTTQ